MVLDVFTHVFHRYMGHFILHFDNQLSQGLQHRAVNGCTVMSFEPGKALASNEWGKIKIQHEITGLVVLDVFTHVFPHYKGNLILHFDNQLIQGYQHRAVNRCTVMGCGHGKALASNEWRKIKNSAQNYRSCGPRCLHTCDPPIHRKFNLAL